MMLCKVHDVKQQPKTEVNILIYDFYLNIMGVEDGRVDYMLEQ